MKDGIFSFKNLSSFPEIIHGISSCRFGGLKIKNFFPPSKNLDVFLGNLGIGRQELVVAEQIHGGGVAMVEKRDGGQIIPGVDALVTPEKGIYLAVHIADCLPIFFYEPQSKIVALCHAGWQGTLKEIVKEVVKKMARLDGQPEKILVGIGPHIKVCCYDILLRRAKLFQDAFGKDEKMLKSSGHKVYLDLTYLNLKQLLQEGIKEENIEVSPYCTFHDSDNFFSYRRRGGSDFSEMLAVLGRRQ